MEIFPASIILACFKTLIERVSQWFKGSMSQWLGGDLLSKPGQGPASFRESRHALVEAWSSLPIVFYSYTGESHMDSVYGKYRSKCKLTVSARLLHFARPLGPQPSPPENLWF